MPKRRTKQQRARRQRLRRAALGVGLVALVAGLAAAWVWHRTLPLQRVEVAGNDRADASGVIRLVGVAPDSTAPVALYGLDLGLLADRAERHPWVREARLRRLPTGTLRVSVTEREPVALVLDAGGAPHHYLDRAGYAMPVPASGADAEDVPLLRGRVPAYHPTQPVASSALRELLGALASADERADAIVSEIEWTGTGATLLTEPAAGRGPLAVRLGRTGHADALARLGAFWEQAVLTRPETPIRLVDLRFAGQVVTREGTERPAAPEASGAPATGAPATPTAGERPAPAAPDSARGPAERGPASGDGAESAPPSPFAAPEPTADGTGTGSPTPTP